MKPTEELKAEHDGILQMLEILQRIRDRMKTHKQFKVKHLSDIIEFLKVFVDQCHHGKEEELLFPALEKAGIAKERGPIGVLLSEHQTGRMLVKEMALAIDKLNGGDQDSRSSFIYAAKRYTDLLRQHIRKENSVLFSMAESGLSQEKQGQLADEFDRLEDEKIGVGRHEEFHRQMEELTKIYLQ